MSIQIELRKSNRIVTLNTEGKTPILSRSGAFNFHNPMELLCISFGACIGKDIWEDFHFNKINIDEFESFSVTIEDNTLILIVQHPKDLSDDVKDNIKRLTRTCSVAKQLKNTPIVKFIENKISKDELLKKDESKKGCCGGRSK